jgi:hypothetical protein
VSSQNEKNFMRREAQKEILILKQKKGTTILNIFFNISQGIFLKR